MKILFVIFFFFQMLIAENTLLRFDTDLSLVLQGTNNNSLLDVFFESISLASIPEESVILFQTFNSRTKEEQASLLSAIALTGITTGILKLLVNRKRPDRRYHPRLWNTRITPSFPSGHAAFSACFATIQSKINPEYSPHFTGYIFLTGYSQIYTGNHCLSDVLAGWVLGFTIGNILNKSIKSNQHLIPPPSYKFAITF